MDLGNQKIRWCQNDRKNSKNKIEICFQKMSNALHHRTVAWVTRPERPKGVKDVIKQARIYMA